MVTDFNQDQKLQSDSRLFDATFHYRETHTTVTRNILSHKFTACTWFERHRDTIWSLESIIFIIGDIRGVIMPPLQLFDWPKGLGSTQCSTWPNVRHDTLSLYCDGDNVRKFSRKVSEKSTWFSSFCWNFVRIYWLLIFYVIRAYSTLLNTWVNYKKVYKIKQLYKIIIYNRFT